MRPHTICTMEHLEMAVDGRQIARHTIVRCSAPFTQYEQCGVRVLNASEHHDRYSEQ